MSVWKYGCHGGLVAENNLPIDDSRRFVVDAAQVEANFNGKIEHASISFLTAALTLRSLFAAGVWNSISRVGFREMVVLASLRSLPLGTLSANLKSNIFYYFVNIFGSI